MPSELQWQRLCSLVSTLGQMRWCIVQLELTGAFLFVRARAWGDLGAEREILFILDEEGEFL